MKNKKIWKRIFATMMSFVLIFGVTMAVFACFPLDFTENFEQSDGNEGEDDDSGEEVEGNATPSGTFYVYFDTGGATGGNISMHIDRLATPTEYSYDVIDSSSALFGTNGDYAWFYLTCNLTRDGYTFVGWRVTNNLSTDGIFGIQGYGTSSSGYNTTMEDNGDFTYLITDSPVWGIGVELYIFTNSGSGAAAYTVTPLFTALWEAEAVTYSISYNSNLSSIDLSLSDSTTIQTNIYEESFTTLSASTFSYDGYTIIGWSTTACSGLMYSDDISWSSSGVSFTGASGTFWGCGTDYVYNLEGDSTLYAVWQWDFLSKQDGYWYFEDGYIPQSYYGTSAPSGVSGTADEAYTIALSASTWAQVAIYGNYAKVTYNSGSTSVSGWFKVEPIVWIVGYGSDVPTDFSTAVTAKVVTCGYISGSTSLGWSWTSSLLGSSVQTMQAYFDLTEASVGDFTCDSFTGTLSQISVKEDSATIQSKVMVSSVDEIDSLGGSYASTCTDFVAFLLSGGASTDGDSYSADYWTRDLAATLDSDSTYCTEFNLDSYTSVAQLNNGVYVTKDGTLSNAKLSTLLGARLTMNI